MRARKRSNDRFRFVVQKRDATGFYYHGRNVQWTFSMRVRLNASLLLKCTSRISGILTVTRLEMRLMSALFSWKASRKCGERHVSGGQLSLFAIHS